jgi:uncharacterized phage protein (TIGR01671 family)
MRDIKFRVWDKQRQRFSKNNMMGMDGAICCSHPEHYVIMQYTGLLDKNGVEVYEEDILKVASNGYSNYISAYGHNCRVEYHEDRCGYIATTGNGYDTRNAFNLNCDAEIKVIGNIYENPELIKDKLWD